MNRETAADTRSHYNFVTDVWRFVLGDNFHLGYFKSNDTNLSEATNLLIEKLANMGNITEKSKVLDVGCGIGEPAFYLYEKFRWSVMGITISEKGVSLAREKSKIKGCSGPVQFQLSDILNNKFSDSSFNVVWAMESSHLFENKEKFFNESYRILEEGGTMLLCDMILKKKLTVLELVKYHQKIAIMERVFGKAKTESLAFYQEGLERAGFSEVETVDVSANVFPTMDHWKINIMENQDRILENFSKEQLDEFLSACNIIKAFYKDNISGYGLVKAVKK